MTKYRITKGTSNLGVPFYWLERKGWVWWSKVECCVTPHAAREAAIHDAAQPELIDEFEVK